MGEIIIPTLPYHEQTTEGDEQSILAFFSDSSSSVTMLLTHFCCSLSLCGKAISNALAGITNHMMRRRRNVEHFAPHTGTIIETGKVKGGVTVSSGYRLHVFDRMDSSSVISLILGTVVKREQLQPFILHVQQHLVDRNEITRRLIHGSLGKIQGRLLSTEYTISVLDLPMHHENHTSDPPLKVCALCLNVVVKG